MNTGKQLLQACETGLTILEHAYALVPPYYKGAIATATLEMRLAIEAAKDRAAHNYAVSQRQTMTCHDCDAEISVGRARAFGNLCADCLKDRYAKPLTIVDHGHGYRMTRWTREWRSGHGTRDVEHEV